MFEQYMITYNLFLVEKEWKMGSGLTAGMST